MLAFGKGHQLGSNAVGVVVVVTVLGCGQAVGQHGVVAFKVDLEGFVELVQGVLMVVVHQLFDGSHGVGVGSKAAPDHAGAKVVHGTARGDVEALFHAAFVHDGHERLGSQVALHALRNDRGNARPLGDVLDLFLYGSIKLFVGVKLVKAAQIGAHLLAVPQRHAVVEHKLDADGPLGIGGRSPLIQTASLLRFNAAHQAVVARVFNAHALGKHHLDVGVVKVHGRKAHARADNRHDLAEIFLGRGIVHACGKRGLVDAHMAHGIHQQIGELVGGVAAFAAHAAHAHVHKGLIPGEELGAALAGEPHHFRHLDEHAARKIKGFVFGHAARFKIGLEQRVHVLVYAANGHAGLVFFHHQQRFHSPHSLNGFPEGAGRMGGNAGVDFRNLEQLGLALGVRFLGGQLGRIFRHAAGVAHDALGGFDHRLVEVNFVNIFGALVVEMLQMGLSFVLDVQHALFHQDNIVAGVGVATAVEGVVRAVRNIRLARKFPQSSFAVLSLAVFVYRLACPVRKNLFLKHFFVIFGKVERILRARADGIHFIPEPAPRNIGRKSASAGCAVGSAHDEFVILNNQRCCFAAIAKSLGAQHNARHAGVFAVYLGDSLGPVNGDARNLLEVVFFQQQMTLGGAFRHARAIMVRHSNGMPVPGGGVSGSANGGIGKNPAQFFTFLRGESFGNFCYFACKIMKIHVDSSMLCFQTGQTSI